jgi:glutathione S-transferase
MAILFHAPTSRSLRVLWTLEEIGATVEVKSLGVRPRLHEPEYLAINPAGTLPAVIDGDRAIYESLAICEYLAAGVVPTWSWRRKSRSGRSSCNGCCTARRLCRRRSRR